MKHVILLIAMLVTCIMASAANVIIARNGMNIFAFKLWSIIPAGAICGGMLGTSGAVPAARYFNIQPTIIDAMLMMVIAAVTMVLIYYLNYATLVLRNGVSASALVDFRTYVDLALTKAHMQVGRGGHDTGEVGQMGYALAGIEFVGFLMGGAATYFLIKSLWCCAHCGSYLRKLKTKGTKEVTFAEASTIIDLFKTGDLEMMRKLMVWAPTDRTLDREERTLISFNLLGCPKCKAEVILAGVSAFRGNRWKKVPALTTRRDLASGLSLRDQFP
jgi:hypothetical protein